MGRLKTRVLPIGAVVFLCGIAGWVFMIQTAVDVENPPPDEVLREFAATRSEMKPTPPMLVTGPDGRVAPNPEAVDDPAAGPRWLKVLSFEASSGRLVRVELPFWWVRLKSIVFEYALAKAGRDPADLGVSVADLRRHGVGVVIDDVEANGDLLLIWTE